MAVKLSTSSGYVTARRNTVAPLMSWPGEVHWANLEPLDEKMQVLGRGLGVVSAWSDVRVTEPTQIHCIDTVSGGEQRDEFAESPPRLGKPMDKQNRSSFGARHHVVQLSSVDCGVMVRDPRQ